MQLRQNMTAPRPVWNFDGGGGGGVQASVEGGLIVVVACVFISCNLYVEMFEISLSVETYMSPS